MKPENINTLIEIAEGLEDQSPRDAYKLYLFARIFRPTGPKINNKISKLSQQECRKSFIAECGVKITEHVNVKFPDWHKKSLAKKILNISLNIEKEQPFNSYVLLRIAQEILPFSAKLNKKIALQEIIFQQDIVVAWREDGLCQRLISILLGYFTAKALELKFRFVWLGLDFMKRAFEIEYADGHSVTSNAEEILASEFVAKHALSPKSENAIGKIIPIGHPRRNRFTLHNLSKAQVGGDVYRPCWRSTSYIMQDLNKIYTPSVFRKFFSTELFNKEIRDEISLVENLGLPDKRIAIHLRGGDVVYGGARNKHTYNRLKSLSLAVADELCKKNVQEGFAVYVFGATDSDLDYLSRRYENVYSVRDLPLNKVENHVEMIRELVLMADCEKLFSAADTAVTDLASLLGNVEFIKLDSIISAEKEYEVLCNCFETPEFASYHQLQKAFCHYSAFITAPSQIDVDILFKHARDAYDADPKNTQYTMLTYLGAVATGDADAALVYADQLSEQINAPMDQFFQKATNVHRFIRLKEQSVQRLLLSAVASKKLPELQQDFLDSLIKRIPPQIVTSD